MGANKIRKKKQIKNPKYLKTMKKRVYHPHQLTGEGLKVWKELKTDPAGQDLPLSDRLKMWDFFLTFYPEFKTI